MISEFRERVDSRNEWCNSGNIWRIPSIPLVGSTHFFSIFYVLDIKQNSNTKCMKNIKPAI